MRYLVQYLTKLKKNKDGRESRGKCSLDKVLISIGELEGLGGDILALSKEAINASINNNLSKAREVLKEGGRKLKVFNRGILRVRGRLGELLQNSQLEIGDFQSIYPRIIILEKDFSDAKEEFFEAKILYSYTRSTDRKEILGPEQLELIGFKTYAGALSDFCGELLRKARLSIIENPDCEKEIKKYLQTTKSIYQALAKFAFSRKSGVRPKVEALKGYISGIENLLYDLNKRN